MTSSEALTLLEAALALPEAERAMIAERLRQTLSSCDDELADDELFGELDRRRQEIEEGKVKPISWADFRFED